MSLILTIDVESEFDIFVHRPRQTFCLSKVHFLTPTERDLETSSRRYGITQYKEINKSG